MVDTNEINLKTYFVHVNDFAPVIEKLDTIDTNANAYTHPTHTAYSSGLYKVTIDASGHVTSAVAVTQSDITALGIASTEDLSSLVPTDIGADVTVVKQAQADSGYASTYVIQQNGTQVGVKINIPKDLLIKSASVETVGSTPSALETANNLSTGDSYLKFIANTVDNDDAQAPLVVPITDLFDLQTADETTITLNNGVYSIKAGVIPVGSSTATDIKMNGTQSAGTSDKFAKADHVHPTDTTRASTDVATTGANGLMSSTDKTKLNGIAEGATANAATTTTPKMDGTATVGSETAYAKGDHVHPTDTSRAAAVHTHSQYLESTDLDDHISLTYDDTTGILKLNFN